MHVELYHTSTELKRLFRKETTARLATRIRAVYLGLMGKSAPEIVALLGYRRRTIQNWVYAYNKHGLEGLSDTSGRGQRCKLNADQLHWLRQRLEEGPLPESGLSVFHGKAFNR
jgi:transposase